MAELAVNVRELRFKRSFDAVDVDQDEITTLADWEEFAAYLCSQFAEPFDSQVGRQVREAVLGWWYCIFSRVEGTEERRLTRMEFAAYYGCADEAVFAGIIPRYIEAIFALCDSDSDGRLRRQEFAGLLRTHGVPEREMTRTMHDLGFDQVGHISWQASVDLLHDFCLSADAHSHGAWLLGAVSADSPDIVD